MAGATAVVKFTQYSNPAFKGGDDQDADVDSESQTLLASPEQDAQQQAAGMHLEDTEIGTRQDEQSDSQHSRPQAPDMPEIQAEGSGTQQRMQ